MPGWGLRQRHLSSSPWGHKLRWTLDGSGFAVRSLAGDGALAHLDLFAKDLGVFDLDRPPRASRRPASPAGYAAVLGRVQVLDVTGRPNFNALVAVVRDAVGRRSHRA